MTGRTIHPVVAVRNIKNNLLKIRLVQLFLATVEGLGNHDAAQRAAGVAYYAILSVFPLILGIIAVFGFFLPSANIQGALLEFIGNNVPGASNILKQNINNIIELRGAMGILSVIIFFWGANGMFSSISLAINRAWEIRRHRPYFIRKVNEFGMALSTGFLFLVSLGTGGLVSILRGVYNFSPGILGLLDTGSRLFSFLLLWFVFLLLYKLVPNSRTYWRYTWPGALVAALFFEVARTLLILYIDSFANYELIYGSVTSIIVLLVWIYYSAFIMILGAEFTYQYSKSHTAVPEESTR